MSQTETKVVNYSDRQMDGRTHTVPRHRLQLLGGDALRYLPWLPVMACIVKK